MELLGSIGVKQSRIRYYEGRCDVSEAFNGINGIEKPCYTQFGWQCRWWQQVKLSVACGTGWQLQLAWPKGKMCVGTKVISGRFNKGTSMMLHLMLQEPPGTFRNLKEPSWTFRRNQGLRETEASVRERNSICFGRKEEQYEREKDWRATSLMTCSFPGYHNHVAVPTHSHACGNHVMVSFLSPAIDPQCSATVLPLAWHCSATILPLNCWLEPLNCHWDVFRCHWTAWLCYIHSPHSLLFICSQEFNEIIKTSPKAM